MAFNPNEDGITHINMFSRGRTDFGRMLSNFYRFPIMTQDGKFVSVEGYWQWLNLTDDAPGRENLRLMYGYTAKRFGNELRTHYQRPRTGSKDEADSFQNKILLAIWYKFRRNASLIDETNRDLPIVHYYTFGGTSVCDVTSKYPWMIEGITKMRDALLTAKETGRSD